MSTEPASISELFPVFADELEELTRRAGRLDLTAQIRALAVVERCRCGEDNCAQFFTAPPPRGRYPTGHWNLLLPADSGLIVLDVVEETIVAIEVLDRPDVKTLLDAYLPPTPRMPDE
ncbi:MAG TPA: hypothetical protein VN999_03065 [Thermoanaerobaculia bacterium]|nr:hypothetical protein [Thermoanaerobaculia bacterium]